MSDSTEASLTTGSTPLHDAAVRGDRARAEELIAAGANLDARNAEGRTALHDAVEHGAMALAERLIEAGAEVDVCAAAILGREARLIELLDSDLSLANDRGTGLTPLGWAAYGNQVGTARSLLAHGARLDDGELLCAAAVGHVEVGRLLLEHGADPDAIHPDAGGNALHAAAAMRYTCDTSAFVEMLLAAGADPAIEDRKERTARQIAEAGARWQNANPPGEGELVRDFEAVARILAAAEAPR